MILQPKSISLQKTSISYILKEINTQLYKYVERLRN